jgi:hypothetical protein
LFYVCNLSATGTTREPILDIFFSKPYEEAPRAFITIEYIVLMGAISSHAKDSNPKKMKAKAFKKQIKPSQTIPTSPTPSPIGLLSTPTPHCGAPSPPVSLLLSGGNSG